MTHIVSVAARLHFQQDFGSCVLCVVNVVWIDNNRLWHTPLDGFGTYKQTTSELAFVVSTLASGRYLVPRPAAI